MWESYYSIFERDIKISPTGEPLGNLQERKKKSKEGGAAKRSKRGGLSTDSNAISTGLTTNHDCQFHQLFSSFFVLKSSKSISYTNFSKEYTPIKGLSSERARYHTEKYIYSRYDTPKPSRTFFHCIYASTKKS